MTASVTHHRAINNERTLVPFIPYSSQVDEHTIMTKDGAYMRIFQLEGTSFETKSPDDMAYQHKKLNAWIKGLAEDNVAVWTHQIRRQQSSSLEGHFTQPFCQQFDQKYKKLFDDKVLVNELYLTVVFRPPLGKRLPTKSPEVAKQRIEDTLARMDKLSNSAMETFKAYNIKPLGCYDAPSGADYRCSEPLRFLNFLLTGQRQHIRTARMPIREYIGNAKVTIGKEVIELKTARKTRYMQGLDIKDYCNSSYSGMLNRLLFEDFEYVLTQSYTLFNRKQAQAFMKKRERQLVNSGDDGVSQIAAFAEAKDDLINGEFAFGEYHFSLMIVGDTVADTTKASARAAKILEDLEILCSPISIATDAAFFAQLPCNWKYRPRVSGMTSRNVAALSPFYNFMCGKREGNPWGQAVTRFQTLAGHPFFFNFHYTPAMIDSFGQKRAANTYIVGKTGEGKTVALAIMLLQLQRFAKGTPLSTVFFDKDRGGEVLIRAMGGTYLRVKNGEPTGFNPFQMEPNKKNIAFLKRFVRLLVEGVQPLNELQKQQISKAVETVMNMSPEIRRLSVLAQNITQGTSEEEQKDSVLLRLQPWLMGGEFGWVFDNAGDLLDFNATPNIGIDGTDFLDNDDIRSPISMYLLHRMDEIIDGRRFCYIMDEAWKWLNDDVFKEFVGDKQLTIRKKNGFGVFAVQLPSAMLGSKVGPQLVQGSITAVYLPNPNAKRNEYVDTGDSQPNFGLTESEYQIVKGFNEGSRLCLVKQGSQSAICSLDLPREMSDEITIMSTGDEDLPFLDEALEEVGHNPENWMPVFLNKVKANKKSQKEVAYA